MNRTTFRFSIFLLAALLGLSVVWFSESLLNLILPTPNTVKSPIPAKDGVRLKLQNIFFDGYRNIYKIEIANESSEILHFNGFGQQENCSRKIQNKNKIELIGCTCLTGVKPQQLKQNEVVTESVTLTDKYNDVSGQTKFGFVYTIGDEKEETTFWTDEFDIPERKHFIIN